MKKTKWMALLLAMLVAGNTNVFAAVTDDDETTESEKEDKSYHFGGLWDNWFVGAGVGIATYNGNYCSRGSFGSRIAPTFNLQVGKWITPVVGLRGNFNWMKAKGYTIEEGNPNIDEAKGNGVYKLKFPFMSLTGEVMIDCINLFKGYKENRFYSLLPYVGAGWVRGGGDVKSNDVGFVFGIDNRFRINSAWSLNLDLRFDMFHEGMDQNAGGGDWDQDFTSGLLVGASYYFKNRGFGKCKVSEAEMENVRQQLAAMNHENQALRDNLAAEKNKPVKVREITRTETLASDMGIFFQIGKSDLQEKDRVNLGFYAETIKKSHGKKFIITGYSDNKTGSKKRNEKLSKERAEAVYDALVNEFGVDNNQLILEYKGGVDNMFYDSANLSRVTIMKMENHAPVQTEERMVEE